MSDFPRMIYRAGGEHELHGVMVDYKIVESQEGLDAALADGWAMTPAETATVFKYPETAYVPPESSDNAPPTRLELETKARELGITFDGRTGDAKLAAKIKAALKG